mgnify:CR=1 FL=1
MQATFYPKVFSLEGIELLVPGPEDQTYIHDKYLNELVSGKFLPDTRADLLAIVDRMKAKQRHRWCYSSWHRAATDSA